MIENVFLKIKFLQKHTLLEKSFIQHFTCWIWIYFDLDLKLVYFIIQNYQETRERKEADWPGPFLIETSAIHGCFIIENKNKCAVLEPRYMI